MAIRGFNDSNFNCMTVINRRTKKANDNAKQASAAVKPEIANIIFTKFLVPKMPAIIPTAKLPSKAIPIEAIPRIIKILDEIAPILFRNLT